MPTIVSTDDLAHEQADDEELRFLLDSPASLNLRKLRLVDSDRTIVCDTSGDDVRPYVPLSLRRTIFDNVHRLSHPGVRATKKLISLSFIWPRLNKDVTRWVKTCLACQRSKIQRHNRNIPEHIKVPDTRFSHVHLDIIGPLPESRDFQYCLTMIDRFTRWPEAVPVADITADTVINAFYAAWIARFGAPSQITTDRGSNFESLLFQALVRLLGVERSRTTPYHPASNGAIERFHRSLKTSIRCHASAEWVDVLPSVLLGLRASLKEDLGTSAAELVYRSPIRLPGEFFTEEDPSPDPQIFLERLRQHIRKVRPSPSAHHISPRAFSYKELHSCTHVFVRVDASKRPFDRPYEGPFEVMERLSDRVYKVKVKGDPVTISTERLKPAFLEDFSIDPNAPIAGPSQPTLRTYPAARLIKKIRFAV